MERREVHWPRRECVLDLTLAARRGLAQCAVHRLRDCVAEKEGQLFLRTRCQGRQIDWLIDTGASVSIISTATWKSLPEGTVRLHSGPRLFGATGQDIRLTGECTLDLRVGDRILEATVLIGDISMDAILGMDLLSQ